MNPTAPTHGTARQAFQQATERWQSLGLRERRILTLLSTFVLITLLWAITIQPALTVLQKAPAELDQLENQSQRMVRMVSESRELRGIAPVSATQAVASLQAATERLGSQGRVVIQGDRVTLTLTNATPEALKEWLATVRSAARARPVEAQLNRAASGYSGTILLVLGGSS